ncbi:MAG: acyltransferase [Magnetococcales bacterium]|nr:acyltransferase [Magnetococcales bacterium]MBF0149594.1 acyltransferase [Magnetococcales bacterium]MBF0347864.1 acyltransferase [Magnetococcales bacterium]
MNSRHTLRAYWTSLFYHFGPKKVFFWSIENLFNFIFSPLPIIGGSQIRSFAFRYLFKKRGKGFFTSPGVRLLHCYNIEIGDRCSLNYNVILNGRGGLIIGDDFTSGPNVIVWTVEHHFKDRTRRVLEQGEIEQPVTIGNDVWCGAQSVILSGVTIADGTVVAAGAVVTRDTEPYSIVGGVPAKVIGYRNNQS